MERVVGMKGVWKSAYSGLRVRGSGAGRLSSHSCHRTDTDIYALDWEMR